MDLCWSSEAAAEEKEADSIWVGSLSLWVASAVAVDWARAFAFPVSLAR